MKNNFLVCTLIWRPALKTGNPSTDTMANSEDRDEMPQYAAFHQGAVCSIPSGSALFAVTKSIFRERNTIIIWKLHPETPLKDYFIKPEG